MSVTAVQTGFFVSLGRFFFRFGIMVFVVSIFFIALSSSSGYPLLPIVSDMSKIFTLSLFIGGGVALAVLGAGRVMMPSIFQAIGIAQYLAFTIPAITGIIQVTQMLITLLPLPSAFTTSLATFISIFGSFSIAYYIAYRLGALPEE
jgi:hypothetical protein